MFVYSKMTHLQMLPCRLVRHVTRRLKYDYVQIGMNNALFEIIINGICRPNSPFMEIHLNSTMNCKIIENQNKIFALYF